MTSVNWSDLALLLQDSLFLWSTMDNLLSVIIYAMVFYVANFFSGLAKQLALDFIMSWSCTLNTHALELIV